VLLLLLLLLLPPRRLPRRGAPSLEGSRVGGRGRYQPRRQYPVQLLVGRRHVSGRHHAQEDCRCAVVADEQAADENCSICDWTR
jgi:hypothetical protein